MQVTEGLRWTREIVPPISKYGIEADEYESIGFDGGVMAKDFTNGIIPSAFGPSTIILNGGFGKWNFEIEPYILKNLDDITLKIDTIRTHGMLHTPIRGKTASIHINGQIVDHIHLVKRHPHGNDFGVDSRRNIPIRNYIDEKKDMQTIVITVDDEVLWDIDRVTLEPIIYKKEIKPEIAMILGAAISSLIGCLATFLA